MVRRPASATRRESLTVSSLIESLQKNFRLYGTAPYRVVVLHGGPGAPGEVAPLARRLSQHYGVIEPLQTADSVEGQVEELKGVLEQQADCPVILIGHSWGAWLGVLLCANYPQLVSKLILVASGSFDESYVYDMNAARLQRLTDDERNQLIEINVCLDDMNCAHQAESFKRLGKLMSKLDSFDPVVSPSEVLAYQYEIYRGVWPQAMHLRQSGELLRQARRIQCPVVAIHGDYDPHPAEGVRVPLASSLEDFRFILLPHCGHTPWLERQACDQFFRVIESVIGIPGLKE